MPRLRPPIVPGSSEIVVAKYRTLPTLGTDDTVKKQSHPAQFKPGQSGNPAGRPRGARNRLAAEFLDGLHEKFLQHGEAAIEHVATKDPAVFLKIISTVMPREMISMALNVNASVDLGLKQKAGSFLQMWNGWRAENGEPEPPFTAEAEIAFKLDSDDD